MVFLFLVCFFLRQALTVWFMLALNLPCNPGWPGAWSDPPASASEVWGLQACATMPGKFVFFLANIFKLVFYISAAFPVLQKASRIKSRLFTVAITEPAPACLASYHSSLHAFQTHQASFWPWSPKFFSPSGNLNLFFPFSGTFFP